MVTWAPKVHTCVSDEPSKPQKKSGIKLVACVPVLGHGISAGPLDHFKFSKPNLSVPQGPLDILVLYLAASLLE